MTLLTDDEINDKVETTISKEDKKPERPKNSTMTNKNNEYQTNGAIVGCRDWIQNLVKKVKEMAAVDGRKKDKRKESNWKAEMCRCRRWQSSKIYLKKLAFSQFIQFRQLLCTQLTIVGPSTIRTVRWKSRYRLAATVKMTNLTLAQNFTKFGCKCVKHTNENIHVCFTGVLYINLTYSWLGLERSKLNEKIKPVVIPTELKFVCSFVSL